MNLKLKVRQQNIRDLYRGIIHFTKGDLVTDGHSILVRWRNHFSQLLNVHGVNP